MSNIEVTGLGGVLRQTVPNGATFPGFISDSDPADPSSGIGIVDSFVIDTPEEPAGNTNGGLLDFMPFVNRRLGSPLIYLPWVKIIVGAGKAWTLYLTHGDGTGTPTTTVDHTNYDVEIASGTGNAHLTFPIELRPGEKLRLVAVAVGSPKGIVEAHFYPVTDAYNRTV